MSVILKVEEYNDGSEYKFRIFDDVEIAKAQAIKLAEDKNFGTDHQRFNSKNRWIGKLGEWAYAELYPQFTPHTKDFEVLKFDFTTPKNERLEVKSNGAKADYEWQSHFNVSINHDQYHEGNYEILVFCLYNPIQKKISIIGWNYFNVFENHPNKVFYAHKAPVYTSRGVFRFNCDAEDGLYDWPSTILEPMKKLEELYD